MILYKKEKNGKKAKRQVSFSVENNSTTSNSDSDYFKSLSVESNYMFGLKKKVGTDSMAGKPTTEVILELSNEVFK